MATSCLGTILEAWASLGTATRESRMVSGTYSGILLRPSSGVLGMSGGTTTASPSTSSLKYEGIEECGSSSNWGRSEGTSVRASSCELNRRGGAASGDAIGRAFLGTRILGIIDLAAGQQRHPIGRAAHAPGCPP